MRINIPTCLLSRFSLAMLVLSSLFWWTSMPYWSPIRFADDFPNCASFGWETKDFSVAAVANSRVSTLFATRFNLFYTPRDVYWSERRDGHFCSFNVPDFEGGEPRGFGVWLNKDTVGWHCPYWVMILLWGSIYAANERFRFSSRDLFAAVAMALLLAAAFEYGFTLPWIVLLNMSSAAAIVFGIAFAPLMIARWIRAPAEIFESFKSVSQQNEAQQLAFATRAAAIILIVAALAFSFFYPRSVYLAERQSAPPSAVAGFGIARQHLQFDLPTGTVEIRPDQDWDYTNHFDGAEIYSFDLGNRNSICAVVGVHPDFEEPAVIELRRFSEVDANDDKMIRWLDGELTWGHSFSRPYSTVFWGGLVAMVFIGLYSAKRKMFFRVVVGVVIIACVLFVSLKSILAGTFAVLFVLYAIVWLAALNFGNVAGRDSAVREWFNSEFARRSHH